MLDRLRHDLELKKQMVTICLIAAIVMAMESIIFFKIVTPQVMDNLGWMLRQDKPVLQQDPVAQAILRCTLAVAHERERVLLQTNNNAATLHAVLIGSGSLLIVLALYAFSGPLRQTSWKPIWIDVGVTAACITVFQAVFYFFGQRWRYADFPVMMKHISEGYREVSKNTNATMDCGPCLEKIQGVLNRSPTYQKLATAAKTPQELLNVSPKQLLQLLGIPLPLENAQAQVKQQVDQTSSLLEQRTSSLLQSLRQAGISSSS